MYEVLTNRAYIGEHYFNRYEKRGGAVRRVKPRDEWVLIKLEPIVDEELFRARTRKIGVSISGACSPARDELPHAPDRAVEVWGLRAGMTLATGKSGKYRYYKCSNRILKGKDTCTSENLPTELVDRLVLSSLADRILTATRVRAILESLRRRLSQSQASQEAK